MRRRVEGAGDHELNGSGRQSGDLGAQLVAGAAGCRDDVGVGSGIELDELLRQADAAIFEQRRGLGIGLGQQSSSLGSDVTFRLADLGSLGVGGDSSRLTGIELRLDLGRASGSCPS